MTKTNSFAAETRKELDAERKVDYTVTEDEAVDLRRRYPLDGSDTPEEYKKFTPEQFFDGA